MFDPKKPFDERKTQRIYDEITQMLEIYYPGFWSDRADDKAYQMAWVAKVDVITKHYYGENRFREKLEKMALICAIIGNDFEEKPELDFIIKRIKSDDSNMTLTRIYNWIRFEVLKKDYDMTGTQYNNWSLRGAGTGMPPITRHIPDFDDEWLPDNPDENKLTIYLDTVKNGGRKNNK